MGVDEAGPRGPPQTMRWLSSSDAMSQVREPVTVEVAADTGPRGVPGGDPRNAPRERGALRRVDAARRSVAHRVEVVPAPAGTVLDLAAGDQVVVAVAVDVVGPCGMWPGRVTRRAGTRRRGPPGIEPAGADEPSSAQRSTATAHSAVQPLVI